MSAASRHRRHRYISLALGLLVVAGCSREAPAPSVAEYIADPRLLEAAVVRCAENRLELKYTDACINAREAVNRMEAAEAGEQRAQLEAESMRKREALRRARQAALEARERAEEAERLRREAEYLSQFEPVPEEFRRPDAAAGDDSGPGPQMTLPATRAPATDGLQSVRDELQKRREGQQR